VEGSVLQLEDATIGHSGHAILSGLTFSLNKGEFCFLLGENGIGKSTLIRTLSGHVPLLKGTLWLSPELRDRRNVGFVPQECSLNPSLPATVTEFISLGLTWSGVSRNARREHLERLLVAAGLHDKRNSNYWTLSGGQRRRALLARALVRDPLLLLLDEPTEGLDMESRESFLAMMQEANEERAMTILFCTHDLSIADRFGTHLMICHKGGIEKGAKGSRDISQPFMPLM